jgi:hypothetical protein
VLAAARDNGVGNPGLHTPGVTGAGGVPRHRRSPHTRETDQCHAEVGQQRDPRCLRCGNSATLDSAHARPSLITVIRPSCLSKPPRDRSCPDQPTPRRAIMRNRRGSKSRAYPARSASTRSRAGSGTEAGTTMVDRRPNLWEVLCQPGRSHTSPDNLHAGDLPAVYLGSPDALSRGRHPPPRAAHTTGAPSAHSQGSTGDLPHCPAR